MDLIRPSRLENIRPHHSLMFNFDRQILDVARKAEDKHNKRLDEILKEIKRMSQEMDNLTAQVHANSNLMDSAMVMINGIADRITAAGVDPQKLNDLAVELKAKDDQLAAAVAANTPQA